MDLKWEKVEINNNEFSFIAQHDHGIFEIIIESTGIFLYNNKCPICRCEDIEDGQKKAETYCLETFLVKEKIEKYHSEKENNMSNKLNLTEEEIKRVAEVLRDCGDFDLANKFYKNEVSAYCSEGKDESYCRWCTASNGGDLSVSLEIDEDDGKTDEQYEAAAIAAFKVLYPEEL